MKGKIFVLDDERGLRALEEAPYVTEDLLQGLLATHPDLLAGDQMSPEAPRRWLLVSREVGVPDAEEGLGRWSLDHLFLDQEGVPTLVEVKRSSDTRLRREVVGQLLDYAANGVAYWPIEKLRALYETDCERLGADPDERLREHVGDPELDTDAFWQGVKTNLQAGRIRMVFLADTIPAELRRIVEFLNTQMDPAEVLAVAVRQYQGEGIRTLVPQVFGRTAEAEARKGGGGGRAKRQWDEASFFAELVKQKRSAVPIARTLYEWTLQGKWIPSWGQGVTKGSYVPWKRIGGSAYFPFLLWTTGQVEIQFVRMKNPPFDHLEERREFRRRLNEIPGLDLPEEAVERQPNFAMELLANDAGMRAFRDALRWYVEQVEVHHAANSDGSPV